MRTWVITKRMLTGHLKGMEFTFSIMSDRQGAGFEVGKEYSTVERTRMIIVSIK